MAKLKMGSRWRSSVCTAEVIIIAAPADDVDLTCGSAPMVPVGQAPAHGSLSPDAAKGTMLGKRYTNGAGGLEVLCTKPGEGSIGVGSTLLALKEAKPLPSSD